MYKISDGVTNFIEKTMKIWRMENEDPVRYKIRGDDLPPLLFVIATMSLNYILRKCIGGYKLSSMHEKINHLMYLEDIKLFTKIEK